MNTQNTLSGLVQSNTPVIKSFSAQLQQTTSTISVPNDNNLINTTNMSTQLYNNDIISDDAIFKENGYRKINKISTTSQGELYKAYQFSNQQYVAIKKANKTLTHQHIAIEDGTTFCVSENIIKEALILQYLTTENKCIGSYIVNFLNFFESSSNYYLVMEYIESEMNLKQFINIAHKYMKQGKLQLKDYQKAIKYLFWQLAVTIQWLHDSMHCSHLDLCCANLMIANGAFLEDENGCFKTNERMTIKLVDFGVSEIFMHSFKCNKQGLTLDNESYVAPKVYSNKMYHAAAADMWSLGMILYFMISGKQLYKPIHIWQCGSLSLKSVPLLTNGYWSLHNNRLSTYIGLNHINTFTNVSFNLLINLLNINEENRLNCMDLLKHKWFNHYYSNYHIQIKKKSIAQKKQLEKQKDNLRNFPFYKLL